MVSNQYSDLSILLHVSECRLKPSQLITWVAHFSKKEQIVVIACLCVQCDNSDLIVNSAIASYKPLGVKSVLIEFSKRLFCEILLPSLDLVINDSISIALSKVH